MKEFKNEIEKKPDYEGFVRHVENWDDAGIPWGTTELVKLAEMYNTPVPTYKVIDGIAQGIEFPKDE